MTLSEELGTLDHIIHEPARLTILTVLSNCDQADFVFLANATGLTKGNLSRHLARLEEAGLIELHKRFVGKKPNTLAHLTSLGRDSIDRHWDQLRALQNSSRKAGEEWRAGHE
jgi:DNA-binding MarR family transcriptional regulator